MSGGMDSPRNTPEPREECKTDTSLTGEPGMLGPWVRDTFDELPPAKRSPTVDEEFRQESTAPRSTDDGSTGRSIRSSSSEAPRIQALRNQLRLLSEKLRPRLTTCSHLTASELCYVCHQRRARNISVNLKDEAQRREQAEEQILLEYQQLRAENEAKREKEYADTKKQRLEAQAAYNLAVIDEHKCRDAQENGKSRSFDMLLHRPCTPLKGTGQDALRAELDKQTEWKRVRQKKEADDRMYQGRSEQKRLADLLANDKLMEPKQKLEKQKKYKEDLDAQVMSHQRRTQEKAECSDKPIFGTHHYNQTKAEDKKRLAVELRHSQMKAAEDRLMRLEANRMQKVEEERSTLKRVQDELVCDGVRRRKAQEAVRRQLQAEWTRSTEEKRMRDEVERMLRICPSELTLMEQCDTYRRCTQCKRDLNNTGRSNLGTDTIAPGMVFVR